MPPMTTEKIYKTLWVLLIYFQKQVRGLKFYSGFLEKKMSWRIEARNKVMSFYCESPARCLPNKKWNGRNLEYVQKSYDNTPLPRDINLIISNKCSNNNHKLLINKIWLLFCVCFKRNQRKSNPHRILPFMLRDCID